MKYAAQTEVSAEKSQAEIQKIVTQYGATGFMCGWQDNSAMVAFSMQGKSVKFILPLPNRADKKITHYHHRHRGWVLRTQDAARKEWDQQTRQRWRALALCIKAKMEAVQCGITTFEHEFLAHFLTTNGETVGQIIIPQLNDSSLPRLPMLGNSAA
jgi:hypothetical protein